MIKLSVAESLQSDVGKSIARMSPEVMARLQIKPGDVVEVKGKKKAVAAVFPGRHEDTGLDIIRIDGTTRFNAQVTLGEHVEAKKVDCEPAQSITIAPIEPIKFSTDPSTYFKERLAGKPVLKGQKITIDIMGRHLTFVVSKTTPTGCVGIVSSTQLHVSEKVATAEQHIPEVSYEDIGGLKKEIELIREMVELPMKHPEVFERLGIGAPKGVLLTGPPGTGKTLLAKAVASETESQFYSINGPEIMSKFYGESEQKLREIFEEANENAPAVVFIDEIDSIAPKRGDGSDQQEKRIVAQLLTSLDGISGRGNVVVMAATNRPDDIDEALRRPGRFDRELRVMPPDEAGRLEILQIHTRGMPLSEDVNLPYISTKTIGYTGADIEVLCKEAAMKALKPYVSSLRDFHQKVPTNVLEKLEIRQDHFEKALTAVEPSAMREVLIAKPKTTWADIGGLEEQKKQLRDAIELPLTKPELFRKAGITPPKGVLLHGPPGTGKTLIAKAVANQANANFISIKGPELISKWVGESEKKLRELFSRARQVAPTVIFFDEFDSISKVRGSSQSDATERMVNQLLTELDGVEELENVSIIAATNRPDLIDEALLRPGRIDTKIAIPLPEEDARKKILAVHTKSMPLAKGLKLESYVKKMEGWSGADIQAFTREAGLAAIREATEKESVSIEVTASHFKEAFDEITKQKTTTHSC